MTPRERVLTGTTVTSITYPVYHRLRELQGTVHSAKDLLQHYGVDFRTVTMPKSPRAFVARHLDEERFEDEYGIVWRRSTYDYSPMVAPLATATVEDIGRASWPDPKDPTRVRGLAEEAKRLFETTEYAVVADIMCREPFELAVKLRGMEQFLTDLVLDERFADAPCWTGSGSSSWGSIREIIPDLIEVGVDALNPIQRNATGMDIYALKREFGRDLRFWGSGIDVQRDLPGADLEEIEWTVRQTVERVGEGGGCVFALTHNLQPDVEPRKVGWAYRSALARPAS